MSRVFPAYVVELDQRGGLVVNGVQLPHQLHYAIDARDEGEAQLSYALDQVSAFSRGRDPGEPAMEVTVQDQRAGGLGVHRFSLPPRATLTLADLRDTASPDPQPSDGRRLGAAQERQRAARSASPVAAVDAPPVADAEPANSVAPPAQADPSPPAEVESPAQVAVQAEPESASSVGPAATRSSEPGRRAGRHRAASRAGGTPTGASERRVAAPPPASPELAPGPVAERAAVLNLEQDPLVAFVRSLAAPPDPDPDPPVPVPVSVSPSVPMRVPSRPVAPIRPQLIEFVPNPRVAEAVPVPEPAPEVVAEPGETPAPPLRRRPGRRRVLIVAVVALLIGFGAGRVVVAVRTTHQYIAICVDMRTERRVQIDRCALTGQDAYRRWYIKAGGGVPAVGEAPGAGGTTAPTERKVRINEAFRTGGGAFGPGN